MKINKSHESKQILEVNWNEKNSIEELRNRTWFALCSWELNNEKISKGYHEIEIRSVFTVIELHRYSFHFAVVILCCESSCEKKYIKQLETSEKTAEERKNAKQKSTSEN